MPNKYEFEQKQESEFVDFAAEREKLFAEFIEQFDSITLTDRIGILQLVLSLSLEDGVGLIERCQNKIQVSGLLDNEFMALRNRPVYEIINSITRSTPIVSGKFSDISRVLDLKPDAQKKEYAKSSRRLSGVVSTFGSPSPKAAPLSEKIVAFYARQLEFKETPRVADPPQKLTRGEDMCWMVVRGHTHMYNKSAHRNVAWRLFNGIFRERVLDQCKNEDDVGFYVHDFVWKQLDERAQSAFFDEYITPDDMHHILDCLPAITEEQRAEFLKEFFAQRRRPLNIVVAAAQINAQKFITEELRTSLERRGVDAAKFEFEKNKKTGLIEFKKKEGGVEGEVFHQGGVKFEIQDVSEFVEYKVADYGFFYEGGGSELPKPEIILRDGTRFVLDGLIPGDYSKVLQVSYKVPCGIIVGEHGWYAFDCRHGDRPVVNEVMTRDVGRPHIERLEQSNTLLKFYSDNPNRYSSFIFDLENQKKTTVPETHKYVYEQVINSVFYEIGDGGMLRAYDLETGQKKDLLRLKLEEQRGVKGVVRYGETDFLVRNLSDGQHVYANEYDIPLENKNLGNYVKSEQKGNVVVFVFYDYNNKNQQGVVNCVCVEMGDKKNYRTRVQSTAFETMLEFNFFWYTSLCIPDSIDDFVAWSVNSDRGGLNCTLSADGVQHTSFGRSVFFGGGFLTLANDSSQKGFVVTFEKDGATVVKHIKSVLDDKDLISLEVTRCSVFLKQLGNGGRRRWRIATLDEFENVEDAKSELTPQEQEKLDLLNTALKPTKANVTGFIEEFNRVHPEQDRSNMSLQARIDEFTGQLETNHVFVRRIMDVVRSAARNVPLAKELFRTMPAKSVGRDHQLAERIVNLIAPEVAAIRLQEAAKKQRAWQDRAHGSDDAVDFSSDTNYWGRDPKDGGGKDLVSFREPTHGFFATGLYTEYDQVDKIWKTPKQAFEIAPELEEPVVETTMTVHLHNGANGRIVLPFRIGSEIIAARVKAIDSYGVESAEPLLVTMHGGIPTVMPPKGAAKIVYSLRRSAVSAVPQDISAAERDGLGRQWAHARRAADAQAQPELPIGALPLECVAFLRSIEKKSPREQIERIESFVREKSYYDFENGEVKYAKDGLSNTDRFTFMRSRVAAIAHNDPEKAKFLGGKLFTGVCADFALVVAAMLRAAGFVSGVTSGFNVRGLSANSRNMHGTAFVLWPTSAGADKAGSAYRVIGLDGTPGGETAEEQERLKHIQQPSLVARAEEAKKIAYTFDAEHAAEFEAIVQSLREKNPAEIKAMTNGMVERAVNAILHTEAGPQHARIIEHVLDVLLYSPASLDRIDWKNIHEKVAVLHFIDDELTRERSLHTKIDMKKSPGTAIMDAFMKFSEKFHRRYPAASASEMFAVLEHVFDGIRAQMDPVEYRIATVVMTYLRAKKMVGPHTDKK